MAGLVFGDIADAIVRFLHYVEQFIVDIIRWLKQAILKLYDALKGGMREAIKYEREVVKEMIRFFSRHDDLAFGLLFAVLFDVLGVNE